MRKLLSFILLALLCQSLLAQVDTSRLGFSVRGTVVDAATGQALESAHIAIPGTHHATVTNADGHFLIKSDKAIRTVVCSHLGYRTLRSSVGQGEKLSIALVRENLPLHEASIISGDPQAIVRAAIDHIGDYYCTQPELLECFYRETVRKRNRYTYVAEAVARLYKSAFYESYYRDEAALEKSRILVSPRKRDTLKVMTLGGPAMAQANDVVKIPEYLFSNEQLAMYRYSMEFPQYIDDRLQFVIRLDPDPSYQEEAPLFHATLYIDRELLSFTRVEASMDMGDKARATNAILVRKPMGLRFFPEEVSIVLNYKLQEGKTRLQYFRSTMRFTCDWRKRLFKTHYTAVNELVVTDVRPQAIPIPYKERFRSKDCLQEKAQEFSDPDFWKDYNIIEPSTSLEHAVGRLRKL